MNNNRIMEAKQEKGTKESVSKMFKRIIRGQLFSSDVLLKYSGEILLVFLLLIGAIANRYGCQSSQEEVGRLKEDLEVVRAEHINLSAQYMNMIRPSRMKKLVEENQLGLVMPTVPPIKIECDGAEQ